MALPETHDLEIEQGKTLKWWFAIVYPDGEVADLVADGYPNARLQVRPVLSGDTYGPAVLTLTTDNGGIILSRMYDAPESDPQRQLWSGYLYASATTTAALTPWGTGVYEMEIDTGSGDVMPALRGPSWLVTEVAK